MAEAVKKKKKGILKIFIVIGVIVALVIAIFILYSRYASQAAVAMLDQVATTPLAKRDLTSSINVSGTVESDENQKVYSKISGYTVESVPVSVGDVVQKGDVLARLDVSALQSQIDQNEASLSASESASSASVDTARRNLESAQRNYETIKRQIDEGRRPGVVSAQLAIDNAETAVTNAQIAYDDMKFMVDLGEASEEEQDTARRNLENAQKSYTDAEKQLVDAIKDADDALDSARDSVKTAENSVRSAQAGQDTKSQRIGIEQLKDQIADGVITAPISGTVTMVNLTEGSIANSASVAFVIEDVLVLKVKTKVREYDAPNVQVGQNVIIKSDATGDVEISGVVNEIAPTAIKTATGDAQAGGTVEFETEVMVVQPNSGLKVGMNTQIYIITEQKKDVFSVVYSAVVENEQGQDVIYVMEGSGEARISREIPVTIGLESDYMIEIISDELRLGMEVVDNPATLNIPGLITATEPPSNEPDAAQNSPESTQEGGGTEQGDENATEPMPNAAAAPSDADTLTD